VETVIHTVELAALSTNLGCPSAVEAVIHRIIIFFIVAVSSNLGCPYVVEVIIFLRAAVSTTMGCPSLVEAALNRLSCSSGQL
jgi:hypothetical protein